MRCARHLVLSPRLRKSGSYAMVLVRMEYVQ